MAHFLYSSDLTCDYAYFYIMKISVRDMKFASNDELNEFSHLFNGDTSKIGLLHKYKKL